MENIILNLHPDLYKVSQECRELYGNNVLDTPDKYQEFVEKKKRAYNLVVYNTAIPFLDDFLSQFPYKDTIKTIMSDAKKITLYKADRFFLGVDKINEIKYNELVVSKDKRIAIVIPNYQHIETECLKSVYDLLIPPGFTTELIIVQGYTVETARNRGVEIVINGGFDYTLWVDSDIILPPNILPKLLSTNADIATGWYPKKLSGSKITELYGPDKLSRYEMVNIMTDELPKNGGVIPILGCGFGCTLVKNHVYSAIGDRDWFHYHSTDGKLCSEDLDFCKKAKEKGFSIVADTSLRCPHIGKSLY